MKKDLFYYKTKLISRFRQKFGDGPCAVKFKGRVFHVPEFSTFSSELSDIFLSGRDYFKADTDTPRIIDIGANVGLGTFYFKTLYPKARIMNFEANPDTYEYLIKNTAHIADVVNRNVAVGDGREKDIYHPSSSLSSTTIANGVAQHVSVPGAKLSDILTEETDLLKIDCEGAEYEILREARDKLNLAKRIFIEYHPVLNESAVSSLRLLEDAGFDVNIIYTSATHTEALAGGSAHFRLEVDAIRR